MEWKAVMAVSVLAGLGLALLSVGMEGPGDSAPVQDDGVEKFSSAEEFREYLSRSSESGYASFSSGLQAQRAMETTAGGETAADSGSFGGDVERYSGTNVQVTGVDEPDILKTDGKYFYYSPEQNYYNPAFERGAEMIYPRFHRPNISVMNTLPGDNISVQSQIKRNGEMLLSNRTLVVFEGRRILGYDISDPTSPEREWSIQLNGSVVTSRMKDGDVYVVLEQTVDPSSPCPIIAATGPERTVIPCTSIYHPVGDAEADTTYTVLRFDAGDGTVDDSTSFVGSRSNTVVYMSEDSIYLTYQEQKSTAEILIDFFDERGGNVVDRDTSDRIEKLDGYEISDRAKMVELQTIIEEYRNSLPRKEREGWQKRLRNEMGNYSQDHRREFVSTGIARIATGDLEVEETGKVPGSVNDQFSMDESDGRLRIATTVGDAGFSFPDSTANDLYVLDSELDISGSVRDMGLDERIYSVRYIEDRAYVVTFRRIDPFHVVDLSDPENPELEGELKLPGFSSYLHPLGEDRVLGLGEENFKLKAVIFDVSDASDPVVEESMIVDSYSSEVNWDHHAFTIDPVHEIFFVPGSGKGYIFDYGDGLEKLETVDIDSPRRARYVNDYLYVFGEREVVVLNEEDWSVVNRFEFRKESGLRK